MLLLLMSGVADNKNKSNNIFNAHTHKMLVSYLNREKEKKKHIHMHELQPVRKRLYLPENDCVY